MTDPHELFRPGASTQPTPPSQPTASQPPSDSTAPHSDQPATGPAQPTSHRRADGPETDFQYGLPQYGQPQYGQPAPGQPQYGQPAPGQPAYGQPMWEGLPGAAPKRPNARRSAAVAAAAVAVVVGGGVAFAALRDMHGDSGAASPQGAVKSIVSDLGESDILGVLDDLPPAERAAVTGSFTAQVTQLKRLKVLDQSAKPGKVSGVRFTATGLTYAKSDEVVNNHVRIVTLTGGTVTVNADVARVPFTKQFLAAAFGGKPPKDSNDTYDLAKTDKPVRIAVQKAGGKWYPSVLYSAVDAAIKDDGLPNPTSADAVGPKGAGSADEAVRRMVTALTKSDYNAAIGLLDPSEDAALHDYAKLLTRSASTDPSDVRVDALQLTDAKVDGGVRVSLKSVTFTADGDTITVTVGGSGCLTVTAEGKTERQCGLKALDRSNLLHLSAAQRTAVDHLVGALPKIGVVAAKTGGQWYLRPVRSYADVDLVLLNNLQGDDLLVLVKFFRTS